MLETTITVNARQIKHRGKSSWHDTKNISVHAVLEYHAHKGVYDYATYKFTFYVTIYYIIFTVCFKVSTLSIP